MLKSYLKLAWKVLLRRKFFTFISLFGISFTLVVLMLVTSLLDHVVAGYPPETKHASTVGIYLRDAAAASTRGAMGLPASALLDKYARDLPNVEMMTVVSMPSGAYLVPERPADQVVPEADGRQLLADSRLPLPRGRALHRTRRRRTTGWWR